MSEESAKPGLRGQSHSGGRGRHAASHNPPAWLMSDKHLHCICCRVFLCRTPLPPPHTPAQLPPRTAPYPTAVPPRQLPLPAPQFLASPVLTMRQQQCGYRLQCTCMVSATQLPPYPATAGCRWAPTAAQGSPAMWRESGRGLRAWALAQCWRPSGVS